MDCPVCGWKVKLIRQWEANNFACGILRCDDCECDITLKTPIHKMRSWPNVKCKKPLVHKPQFKGKIN